MPLIDDMNEMESRLRANGQSVSKLCDRAGLARSTWDRWKRQETAPNFKSWDAIREAVEEIAPLPATSSRPSGKDAA